MNQQYAPQNPIFKVLAGLGVQPASNVSLAKRTWARLSWGGRMTQWLRGDSRRNFKEKAAYRGNPHKTAYWLATSNSSVCVCAVTLSQMGFVDPNTYYPRIWQRP